MTEPVGVVLAAGRGSRMGALGERVPKALLPVGDKPVVGHGLDLMRTLGIRRAFLVVGHRGGEIKDALGDGGRYGLELTYVEQMNPLGIAHALGVLRPHVRSPFLLLLGDYYAAITDPSRLGRYLRPGGGSAIVAKRETDPRLIREACELEAADDGRVRRIVEKPAAPSSDLKGCGVYALQPEVFDAVGRTPRTALRDEYELTVSLELFVAAGHPLYAEEIVATDANFTRPADVLACNLRWLADRGASSFAAADARLPAGIVLDRAVVGSRAVVHGPTALKHVVVFPDAHLEAAGRIENELIVPGGRIPCLDAPLGKADRHL